MSWFAERRDTLQRLFRWLAVLTFVLTAIQPVLGAFGFFRKADSTDYTAIHGVLANILFPLAALLLALAFVSGFERARRMQIWTLLLVIAVVSQIGLGYSARGGDQQLLAIHIPSGVAVFACALVVALLSFGLTLRTESA